MNRRVCVVTVDKASGEITAIILEGTEEVASIHWSLGSLFQKDPALAMDMVNSRFREWARSHDTAQVQVKVIAT